MKPTLFSSSETSKAFFYEVVPKARSIRKFSSLADREARARYRRHGSIGEATFFRDWSKPERNGPCPCGAFVPREQVLRRARERFEVAGVEELEIATNLAFLEASIDARVARGGPAGDPIKLKKCHGSELGLIASGVRL